MKDELVKDLEAMVNWNDLNPTQDWETMTMTFELDDENIRRIAKGLIELGYIKVVRCGECINWDECGKYGICCLSGRGRRNPDAYCSEGEAKEGKG